MLGRKHVNRFTAHAECAPAEVHVVALVLHADQLGDHVALPQLVARPQRHDHLVVALGLSNAVDGRYRRDDQHIAPLQDAFGARQTHLLNMLVDSRVFLNEQITLWNVSLGLVIVVVTDKVFDRIVRKELPELAVQLRRQRLVRCKNNSRPPKPGNDVGHGECFSGSGHAQQGLEHFTVTDSFHQFVDGGRLIPCGRVRHEQLKRRIRKTDEFALLRLRRLAGAWCRVLQIAYDFGCFSHGLPSETLHSVIYSALKIRVTRQRTLPSGWAATPSAQNRIET